MERHFLKSTISTRTIICIFIIILYIAVPSFGEINFTRHWNDNCPNECECSADAHNYNIKCSIGQIQITAFESDTISIDCSGTELLLELLPAMNLGEVEIVELINCPLSSFLSIRNITNSLGAKNYTKLIYESDHFNSNLNKIHFSGLNGLKDLKINIKTTSYEAHIDNDLFMDQSLKKLKRLEFFTDIIELSADIFTNLENLRSIKIGKNIKYLSSGVFRNQKNLHELWFQENHITYFPSNLFFNNSSLHILDLSRNQIETLDSDVFESLPNLTTINLSSNNFFPLPFGLFKNNKNLKSFKLLNNGRNLKTLPSKLLADLPNLRDVQISCELESLPKDLFLNSMNIDEISITTNHLNALPEGLFESQHNIKKIDLYNNEILEWPEKTFRNSRNLILLNLSGNRLLNITSRIFDGIIHLEELDLSMNGLQVETINFNSTLGTLSALKKLNLSNNDISYIPTHWNLPLTLNILDLSDNRIITLNGSHIQWLISSNVRQFFIQGFKEFLTITLDDLDESYIEQNTSISIITQRIELNCKLLNFIQHLRGEFKPNLMKNIIFQVEPHITKVKPEDLLCKYYHDDNNENSCPDYCDCWIRSYDKHFIVDCSNIYFEKLTLIPDLPNIELLNLSTFALNVENNHLTQLPSFQTPGYANVTSLKIAGNNLTIIEPEYLPSNLMYLDVRRNQLSFLTFETLRYLQRNKKLKNLYFSKNPWSCNCDKNSIMYFSLNNNHIFTDFSNLTCANIAKEKYFYEYQDLCPYKITRYISLAIVLSALGLILASLIAIYYKYQMAIKIWLYANNMCLRCITEYELDSDKIYDAFISYSSLDEDFVLDTLVPELENGLPPFKLCIDVRDWLIGEYIANQIHRSVNDSRRTVVVLSKNFLASVWTKMEFKAALRASLNEGRVKVIAILYSDIGSIDDLDPDLKTYLQMTTYLKWGDPLFWQKLRYAMPHRRQNEANLQNIPLQKL